MDTKNITISNNTIDKYINKNYKNFNLDTKIYMNYKQNEYSFKKKVFHQWQFNMIVDFVTKFVSGFIKYYGNYIQEFYNTVIQYGINFNGIKQTICLAICTAIKSKMPNISNNNIIILKNNLLLDIVVSNTFVLSVLNDIIKIFNKQYTEILINLHDIYNDYNNIDSINLTPKKITKNFDIFNISPITPDTNIINTRDDYNSIDPIADFENNAYIVSITDQDCDTSIFNKNKIITQLPVTNNNSEDSCPICQTEYTNEEKIMTLPCIHSFHVECATMWLEDNDKCPICLHSILGII